MSLSYVLDAPARTIADALGADCGNDPWVGGTVTAGSYAPVVIRGRDGRRRLVPRQFGVPPPPRSANPHVVTTLRNLESPFWIGTLRHTQFRCLVPTTHLALGGRGRWWASTEGPIMALAGIWRDSEVPSFAIVTVAIDRLSGPADLPQTAPLLLTPREQARWLTDTWANAEALARPLHPDRLHRVGAGNETRR